MRIFKRRNVREIIVQFVSNNKLIKEIHCSLYLIYFLHYINISYSYNLYFTFYILYCGSTYNYYLGKSYAPQTAMKMNFKINQLIIN